MLFIYDPRIVDPFYDLECNGHRLRFFSQAVETLTDSESSTAYNFRTLRNPGAKLVRVERFETNTFSAYLDYVYIPDPKLIPLNPR